MQNGRSTFWWSLGDYLLGVVVLCRAWCRPDIHIEALQGEVRLERRCLSVADEQEATAATGLFLRTFWMRDRLWRRKPVKLELLAGEYDAGQRRRATVDLLISVGASVHPGLYVARREFTALRVRVGA